MHARTRMFLTLLCLVLAMTACTAILAWLEPHLPQATGSDETSAVAAQALASVAKGGDIGTLQNGVIEIVGEAGLRGHTGMLAATQPPYVDFIVSGSGVVRSGPRWARRSAADMASTPILVCVVRGTRRNTIESAQWAGLQALVAVLKNRIEAVGGRMSIRIAPSVGAESARLRLNLPRLRASDGVTSPMPRQSVGLDTTAPGSS